ncbi:MAG: bifunctional pyr operon transcriptional regulator/uracil phosphoribosyltransferase PyrR [Gemmatimonadota bacterium]|nr:bifunctional pyr operon transcriptional regulator/uracil phosphoribosyltransferase PyrR [Gemmatimonadota bacterium]MDH3422465.1 bifunctional pyr operon transcriptional regulator/uracil phosphoribosyltransferase PyrR [Gemmatimonadota bacterium]
MPEDNRIHLMDEADVRREVARMAREIVERNEGTERLVLMGIHRRGTQIAALLKEEIERSEGTKVATGSIDITLYRDDLGTVGPRPVVGESVLPPVGLDDQNVVIVDDVAYTGRTVRAALNELGDWGRPSRILLCVLVDRGGRELPIQPDITGRIVEVQGSDRVEVHVPELDGRLGVDLVHAEAGDE